MGEMHESGACGVIFELPRTWTTARLFDVCHPTQWKTISISDLFESGYPVYGANGRIGCYDDFTHESPTIMITCRGATCGNIHISVPFSYINGNAMALDGLKEEFCALKYLSYFLHSRGFNDVISGTAQPQITRASLSPVEFPLAPIKEQTRIVEKLEELLTDLDAGVAELKAAQKKLGQYRQSLLKAAVEGALTADWRKNQKTKPAESGAQLLKRILHERRTRWEAKQLAKFKEQGKTPVKGWQSKYVEPVAPETAGLPELPKGWVWASLDMLGEIVSGVAKGTKRSADTVFLEVPYLRVANVQRGYLDLSEVKTIPAMERDIKELALLYGDVLFNEGGDRDKLGRGWVWRDEVANCIHQNHVFRMRPYLVETLSELVSHQGNTFGKTWFKFAGKQTTNLASISMGILRIFPVPVAPADEQKEILLRLESQIEVLDTQEKSVELALKQSSAQRKNILKAAFCGQLVPQDPQDEPASALLARIRQQRAERAKEPKASKARSKTNKKLKV